MRIQHAKKSVESMPLKQLMGYADYYCTAFKRANTELSAGAPDENTYIPIHYDSTVGEGPAKSEAFCYCFETGKVDAMPLHYQVIAVEVSFTVFDQ